ncbi:uncharacterized protein LOC129913508 isoform X1 [Episyrphus balteatus]|uniref:uncharacterized protein LOC129913508 isoform X1 n=1 Tax=Episyrphus balteatus TaxID=286459 RepID=UPI002485A0B6|nr:uncharacterized protein LOC129913508 isoform X1 [Episyrphus balteatus]
MPRPQNNSLFALYKLNEHDQIVCYQEKCNGKVLYKHSANLERHLRNIHPLIYASYVKKKKIIKFPRKLNFEKRLIDCVRNYPLLWDKSDGNRFNEDLIDQAWNEIRMRLEVTVSTCKQKWENLIDKFKHELVNNPPSIDGVESLNGSTASSKQRWKYFNELLFLRDHIDLTNFTVSIPPEQMECMRRDYIKEESSESFLLYNDTLEQSSFQDDREESLLQESREDSRLRDESIEEQRAHNDREASRPPDNRDPLKLNTKSNTTLYENQSKKRPAIEETESEDDYDNYLNEKLKQMKRKKFKSMLDNDNSATNESDTDRMFLLSLLPFLKTIPHKKKLSVRHRIQGVLLEEHEKIANNL